MTATEAQAVLRSIAFDLVRLEERCQEVLDSLPRSENEAVMFEGRTPWELPTELQVKSPEESQPPLRVSLSLGSYDYDGDEARHFQVA